MAGADGLDSEAEWTRQGVAAFKAEPLHENYLSGMFLAVTSNEKLLNIILSGRSDSNIAFSELRRFLLHLGFEERIKGSHHIFFKSGVTEILNLQPDGSKAKAYQVKQVRNIILKYQLGGISA